MGTAALGAGHTGASTAGDGAMHTSGNGGNEAWSGTVAKDGFKVFANHGAPPGETPVFAQTKERPGYTHPDAKTGETTDVPPVTDVYLFGSADLSKAAVGAAPPAPHPYDVLDGLARV